MDEKQENPREILAEVQRLPVEAQRTIYNMLHGAIVISNMYSGPTPPPPVAGRPSV